MTTSPRANQFSGEKNQKLQEFKFGMLGKKPKAPIIIVELHDDLQSFLIGSSVVVMNANINETGLIKSN